MRWSSDVDFHCLLPEYLVMTVNQCSWSIWSDFSWVVLQIVFSAFPDLIPMCHLVWGALQCKCSKWTLNSVSKEVLLLSQNAQKNAGCLLYLLTEKPVVVFTLAPQSFSPACSVSVFFLPHCRERKKRADLQGGSSTSLLETTKHRSPVEGCLAMFYVTTLNMLLKKGACDVSA